jgi:class 3 adenylate cyclase
VDRFGERVRDLLEDARGARRSGDLAAFHALTSAVLALDPGNAEAEALRAGAVQRRQMTLLFCDIVGSTAIADVRDPEEMSRILRSYRAVCTDVVRDHGGVIDDHQGDGMLVRFGCPEVREDDARRAVLCGLRIVEAVRERTADSAVPLHVRIAVHTDLVVLDGVGVAGATTNEAARIQNLALPDTVVISDTTEAIVRGWFDVRSRGLAELRGVARPVEVFTVVGDRPAGCADSRTMPTPFAGRRSELARIEAVWKATEVAWREATAGREVASPPGLLVTGPPGVGKTRLLAEAARAMGAPCTECRCSRYHDTTSLYPFRAVLEEAVGIERNDDAARRLTKLRARLHSDHGESRDLPFLAAALQIPPSMLSPPRDVDPSQLRQAALQAAAGMIMSRCSAGPLVLMVDDVQWADQSTLDLLTVLFSSPHACVLILLGAREGFQSPWPTPAVVTMSLDPMHGADLEELASRASGGARLSPAERAELIDRSDGMPLFLEELVRTAAALAENRVLHRSVRYADFAIPAALRDPLLARLTTPGVDLELAQLAATVGREVHRDLLHRITELEPTVLEDKLRTLLGAGLVEPLGSNAVRFRHELIREVAYETQTRAVRRARHGRIADDMAGGPVGDHPVDAGQLAFHLARAERYGEAVEVQIDAARADQAIGAHAEATRRLTEALRLVPHLGAGDARDRTELLARELRSFSSVMAGGYAAPEAAEDHRRCVELCEQAGLLPELVPSLIRSWSFYTFRGDLTEADRVNDRIEATGVGEATGLIARAGHGVTAFFEGRFRDARSTLESFVDYPWGSTEGRPPDEWPLPNDPLAAGCALLVPTLWIAGEPDAATGMGERALHRARSLPFPYGPFSVGFVTCLLALTCQMHGDRTAAGRLGDDLVRLGERHGFTAWRLAGAIQAGITAAHEGDAAALDRLAQDVAAWRTLLASDLWAPYWLTELADAQRCTGRLEAATRSLDEAAAVARATGATFYLAQTLRLHGEVRWDRGDPDGAEDIARAYELAGRQGAAMFTERARAALDRALVH